MFSVISDDLYNSTPQWHPSLTRPTLFIAFPVQSSTLPLSCCFFLFIFNIQFQKTCRSVHSNAQRARAYQTVMLSTHMVTLLQRCWAAPCSIHGTPHLAVLQCLPPTELCGARVQNTFVGQSLATDVHSSHPSSVLIVNAGNLASVHTAHREINRAQHGNHVFLITFKHMMEGKVQLIELTFLGVQIYLKRQFSFCEGIKTQKRPKYIAMQLLTTGNNRIVTDLRKGAQHGKLFCGNTLPFQQSNSRLNGVFDTVHNLH